MIMMMMMMMHRRCSSFDLSYLFVSIFSVNFFAEIEIADKQSNKQVYKQTNKQRNQDKNRDGKASGRRCREATARFRLAELHLEELVDRSACRRLLRTMMPLNSCSTS